MNTTKIKCRNWSPDLEPFRYAHAKLDGLWATLRWEIDDGLRCYSSKPSDLTGYVEYLRWFQQLAELRSMASIHGELWLPGAPASEVKSALIRRDPAVRLTAFAVENCGLLSHDADLEQVQHTLEHSFGHVDFAPFSRLNGDACDPGVHRGHFEYLLESTVEGVVFKDGNLSNWYKWKPVNTVDCVVTGWKEGRGKYLGLVGSLEASLACGRVIATGLSGFDDAERERISAAPMNETLGRVVEIAYQYVGAGGRLRHPRFVRWRDDKRPEECTEDQLS